MSRIVSLITALVLPWQSMAHPHVFVQAQMTIVFDPSGEVGVQLDWFYDEFFSLLVSTDLGIDLDGNTKLTKAEQTLLDEQITAWPPDYQGDLEVMQGDTVLPLADKRDHRMTFTDGVFHEVHLRPVAALEDRDAPLIVRAYDPTYYIAYDLIGEVKIKGRDDCTADIARADLDAAYTMVEELLYGRPASDVGPDEYFPEVGQAFADTVTVTCAQPL
ncbi:DUF1007 family protein [Yoonia sp. 2307UL14-13]|uniref:DUF1007 family protein n=1 Tax=Yoonia sp. 2307UL14-13 TaxID=3126506 RepID=UPI0030A99D5F